MAPAHNNSASKSKNAPTTKRIHEGVPAAVSPSGTSGVRQDSEICTSKDGPGRGYVPRSWLGSLFFKLDCLAGGPILNEKEVVLVYILVIGLIALIAVGSMKQFVKLLAVLTA